MAKLESSTIVDTRIAKRGDTSWMVAASWILPAALLVFDAWSQLDVQTSDNGVTFSYEVTPATLLSVITLLIPTLLAPYLNKRFGGHYAKPVNTIEEVHRSRREEPGDEKWVPNTK